ncbi:MAG: SIS domain-containing protein [Clostridiales Family XIII bacterium]|jgi:D-sedoheptulose 7-phosphate isomerase|nr:SIS domain-containing protein [Clostridiales Family XIII bacterium]
MSYSKDYTNKVFVGIKATKVFVEEKKEIDFDLALRTVSEKLNEVKKTKRKVFFIGNGASATMAEHMSADFFKNANIRTVTSSETSYLTAVTNDIGGQYIFSHRVEMLGDDGDIIVAISSSGNSPNILNAINSAKKKDIFAITLTGLKEDNKAVKLGDINFYVPLKTYGLVESAHPLILHMIIDNYLDSFENGSL